MSGLTRYLRLYGHFLAFSFSKSFEFRFDFFSRILMDVVYYAIAIFFYQVIFLHTSLLGGWNEKQMMVFVAGYCMVDAINMTVFANNLFQLPTFVNRGDLDYYLIRPISTLFFLSLRDFSANSFMNLLITVGMLGWALHGLDQPIAPLKVLMFVVLIANGSLLFFTLNMIFTLPVFFAHSAQGFGQLVWGLSKFLERPDRIFTGWTRRILVFILPFCVIASFPTRLLLEPLDPLILAQITGVTFCFFCLMLWIWRLAIRNYSSASS